MITSTDWLPFSADGTELDSVNDRDWVTIVLFLKYIHVKKVENSLVISFHYIYLRIPTKTFHADTDVVSAFLVALSSDSLTTSRCTAVWATDVFQRANDDFKCVVLQNWAETWSKRLL